MPFSLSKDDSIENKPLIIPDEPHLPAVIILDVVGKAEEYENELVNAFEALRSAIEEDSLTRGRLELCIVTNLGNGIVRESFGPAVEYLSLEDNYFADIMQMAQMQLGAASRLDGALNISLSCIDSRLNEYNEVGVTSYQPWIMVFSDGKNVAVDKETTRLFRDSQEKNRFRYIPVLVGENYNSKLKNLFSDSVEPYIIKPTKEAFGQVFAWWEKSTCVTSSAVPISVYDYINEELAVNDASSSNEKSDKSYTGKWLDYHNRTAIYIDAFINALKEKDIQYDENWDEDTGAVSISLNNSNNYLNHIEVGVLGKTVIIRSVGKWSISPSRLDRYCFEKYNLLKSTFESDLKNEQMLVRFEHVTYLHADPAIFCEYLLMLVKKFDVELDDFITTYSLSTPFNLPPTPSIVRVGI